MTVSPVTPTLAGLGRRLVSPATRSERLHALRTGTASEKTEWGRRETLERRAEFTVERYDVDPGATMVWRRATAGTPSIGVLAGEADLGPACGRFSVGDQIPVTFEEWLSIANAGDRTLSLLVSTVAVEGLDAL